MTGATTAAASRLAGSDASETCSKCSAISGAVAMVAATVIAATSATGPGTRRRVSAPRRRGASASRPATAANESCQPGSPTASGLSASVTRRREPERVPARGRAPGQRGDEAGDAHHPRALDRRAGAGERHVDRDQHDRGRQPRSQRHAGEGTEREHERAQQQHVLAADRQQVRQSRALEVGLGRLADRLVLAEHHAAQQRGLGRVEPGAEPARRALAGGVERPGEPAARASGGRPRAELDRGVRAAPALVVLETRRAARPSRAHAARCRHGRRAAAARAPPARRPTRRRGRSRRAPAERRTGQLGRAAAADHRRPGEPDARDERCRCATCGSARAGSPGPSIRCPASAGSRPGPSAATRAWASAPPPSTATAATIASGTPPGERRRQERRDEQRRTARAARAGDRRPTPNSTRWRGWRRISAAASAVAAPHSVTSSRSVARRTSPMPGISPSSSTEPKPPRSSRKSRIFCAVSGPMPLSVSSCSSVARVEVERLARRRRRTPRPSAAAAAPARHPLGHEHLAAVLELRRQVEPAEVGPPPRARRRARPRRRPARTARACRPRAAGRRPPRGSPRDRRRRSCTAIVGGRGRSGGRLASSTASSWLRPSTTTSTRPTTQSASWRGVRSAMPRR